MFFLKETLVAVFAAVGMGTTLYFLLRPVFTLPKRFFSPVLFLLRIGEDTEAVEDTVRELQELCRDYGENARIALVDAGMDEEQKRIVRILCREDDSILLLRLPEDPVIANQSADWCGNPFPFIVKEQMQKR